MFMVYWRLGQQLMMCWTHEVKGLLISLVLTLLIGVFRSSSLSRFFRLFWHRLLAFSHIYHVEGRLSDLFYLTDFFFFSLIYCLIIYSNWDTPMQIVSI